MYIAGSDEFGCAIWTAVGIFWENRASPYFFLVTLPCGTTLTAAAGVGADQGDVYAKKRFTAKKADIPTAL
jgi:hypothetical protein